MSGICTAHFRRAKRGGCLRYSMLLAAVANSYALVVICHPCLAACPFLHSNFKYAAVCGNLSSPHVPVPQASSSAPLPGRRESRPVPPPLPSPPPTSTTPRTTTTTTASSSLSSSRRSKGDCRGVLLSGRDGTTSQSLAPHSLHLPTHPKQLVQFQARGGTPLRSGVPPRAWNCTSCSGCVGKCREWGGEGL